MNEPIAGVSCTSCQQPQNKDRRHRIVAAPKILAIKFHIMLWPSKTLQTLTYPERLNLGPCQTHQTLPLNYRLAGLVAHTGTGVDNGHYIATVRNQQPGNFTCVSDDEMEDFSLAELLTNPQDPQDPHIESGEGYQVYMLLYERDDVSRNMPTRPVRARSGRAAGRSRLKRELRNLM